MESHPTLSLTHPGGKPPLAPDLSGQMLPVPTAQPVRSQRPRPSESGYGSIGEPVPLQPQAIKRQSSKNSLRSFFSRRKSTREPRKTQDLPVVEEARNAGAPISQSTEPPLSPTSTVVSAHTVMTSPDARTGGNRNHAARSKAGKEKPFPTITSWDPPPLFQAYPQAVRHTCLLTPTLSADSILRINTTRRRSYSETQSKAGNAVKKRREEREKRHVRKISGSISKTEWAQKIFVLVTSGYLLQYAGEGNFDRLPEKMMQLGSTSAAFASDAIPGKHWVLQISQSSDEDGRVTTDHSKGLLSRFGFYGADSRRSARSFLLVFTDPEEMNSWLVILRREIEALGGKKYTLETTSDDDSVQQLQNKPSLRKLVTKDSDVRSGHAQTSSLPTHAPSLQKQNSYQELRGRADSAIKKEIHRRSMPAYTSAAASSMQATPAQRDLEFLRERATVSSYRSVDSRNGSSLQESSSSSPSPVRAQTMTLKLSDTDQSQKLQESRVAALQTPKRRSMYTYTPMPPDQKVRDDLKRARPRSVVANSYSHRHSTSPPTPNFSVPSFSRRFTSSQSPARRVPDLSPGQEDVASFSSSTNTPPSALGATDHQGNLGREDDSFTVDKSNAKARRRRSQAKETPSESDAVDNPLLTSHEPSISTIFPKRVSSLEYSNFRMPDAPAVPPAEFTPMDSGREEKPPGLGRPQSETNNSPVAASLPIRRPISMNLRSETNVGLAQESQYGNSHLLQNSVTLVPRPPRSNRIPVSNLTMIGAATKQKGSISTGSTTQVSPRKSMPNLSRGTPIAPPPRCPLPAIPSTVASQHQSVWREDTPPFHLPSSQRRRSMGPRKSHIVSNLQLDQAAGPAVFQAVQLKSQV